MDVPRRAAPLQNDIWHALRRAAPRQGGHLEHATPRRAISTPRSLELCPAPRRAKALRFGLALRRSAPDLCFSLRRAKAAGEAYLPQMFSISMGASWQQ